MHSNIRGNTHHDILFQDVVLGLNLQQLIREPTRISTPANLRDPMLASDNTKVSAYGILSPFSEMNHIHIFISTKYATNSTKSTTKQLWDFHKIYIYAFANIPAEKDWNNLTTFEIDVAVSMLTEFKSNAALRCIPKREIEVQPRDKF